MEVVIKLTNGFTAVVDSEDADLSSFRWYVNHGYARRNVGRKPDRKNIALHTVVLLRKLNRPFLLPGECVDHIDGDTLNNRRSNLRLATRAQNSQNQRKRLDNKSGFKGVYRRGSKWVASIAAHKIHKYLGTFNSPEKAHEAYCEAAKQLHKEFSRLE